MMKVRLFLFFTVIVPLFHGCVSIKRGQERSFADSVKKYQLQVQSVSRVVPKITRIYRQDGHYQLELVAEGRFTQHYGHNMKRGTPYMSVGFFPGCAERDRQGWIMFGIVGLNCLMCGIPTLSSLLVEPFCDGTERRAAAGGSFSDFGLIGVNKYYLNVSDDKSRGFVTESTKNLSTYTLYGYAVMIDGERLEDHVYMNGYIGQVWFRSTRPRGSRIRIRIVKAPSSRSDGNEGFSELEGMEIMATLP